MMCDPFVLASAFAVHSSIGKCTTFSHDLVILGSSLLSSVALQAKALRVNATLTDLNLSGNCIGDEGMVFLCEALQVNTGLTALNMSYQTGVITKAHPRKAKWWYNSIGDASCPALIAMMAVNLNIRHIIVSRNLITSTGAKKLVEAIKVR